MLRVQLNVGDRQSPSQQQQQQQQLVPRPLFQYNATTSFNNSDNATVAAARQRERSNSGQLKRSLPHSQHTGQSSGPPMRPSHSAKGRKVRSNSGAHAAAVSSAPPSSASSSTVPSSSSSTSATNTPIAAGGGRKVLKQEVTQLQHIVDGMQQQVQAATREIQALRSMVGRMADANTQHKLAQLASQQPEQQHQQQQQQQDQLRDQELLQYELYDPHQQHQQRHQHQDYQQQQQSIGQNYHTPHTGHDHDHRQSQSPLVEPRQEELQALALLHAPLMDIYQYHHSSASPSHSGGVGGDLVFAPPGLTDAQQSELVGHFAATFHTASDGHSTGASDDALASIDGLGFDCRMEQALLCDDDDDYPLFFES